MGYFPFYIDIKDKNCLVVGGGRVAFRKIEKLAEFEAKIKVIAPEILPEISELDGVEAVYREFIDRDIDGAFLVIGAADDKNLNSHIFDICSRRNILVNTVNDKARCSFIFPALVHSKDITIGISTSGKSPIFASYIRKKIEDIIDENIVEKVELLGKMRPYIMRKFKSEEQRKNVLEKLMTEFSEKGIMNENEIFNMIEDIKKSYEN